ncbi:UTP-glucose-1-phosphate uridylyltransferase [Phlyctochytrium bullatum]|nr:UTP-glucose-1-phosphate uridylyltransferase [Phlyctochytrium bullatum]
MLSTTPTAPGVTANGAGFDRERMESVIGFQETSKSSVSKAMRNELNKMVASVADEAQRQAFAMEMDSFYSLFTRYLSEKSKGEKIDWQKIKSPKPEQIIPYKNLSQVAPNQAPLEKLAVLKLNGGLGTTMGCVGPKSVIEVRDGMTFLDLTVRQIEYLNKENNVSVPLILMNSFNTDVDTQRVIQKYSSHNVQLVTFNQSRFPRISKESLLPLPKSHSAEISNWYPPGHGDLFESLANSGLLDKLIEQGKEYLFISNVDNLGATVDTAILSHFANSGAEFIMEVTDKTKADVKGGTLIDYDGQVRLLEIAQVPEQYAFGFLAVDFFSDVVVVFMKVEEFKSIKKFKIFNTNNLWVNIKAVKRLVEESALNMEIIVNQKTTEGGEKVIQLETAVGAAIKHFAGAHGVNVPRSRFLPVKSTSDLFLITSDLYSLHHGQLVVNPKRQFGGIPVVKLGDHFKKVAHFLSRFKSPPHILDLDHLTVTGDVTFGAGVVLRGTVIIVANHGSRIDIPSGSILDDKVVSGNLRILDH